MEPPKGRYYHTSESIIQFIAWINVKLKEQGFTGEIKMGKKGADLGYGMALSVSPVFLPSSDDLDEPGRIRKLKFASMGLNLVVAMLGAIFLSIVLMGLPSNHIEAGFLQGTCDASRPIEYDRGSNQMICYTDPGSTTLRIGCDEMGIYEVDANLDTGEVWCRLTQEGKGFLELENNFKWNNGLQSAGLLSFVLVTSTMLIVLIIKGLMNRMQQFWKFSLVLCIIVVAVNATVLLVLPEMNSGQTDEIVEYVRESDLRIQPIRFTGFATSFAFPVMIFQILVAGMHIPILASKNVRSFFSGKK